MIAFNDLSFIITIIIFGWISCFIGIFISTRWQRYAMTTCNLSSIPCNSRVTNCCFFWIFSLFFLVLFFSSPSVTLSVFLPQIDFELICV